MMLKMHIEASSYSLIYNALRNEFLNKTMTVNPRGFKTKEILNAMITIRNPRKRLAYHKDRKYNLTFNIAELLSIVGNINYVKFLSYFNKNVAQFSDNGISFYGAYGPRLNNQWFELINKLVNDNSTRQAIMTIYDGKMDISQKTKDVPCTLNLHFMIRDNKLNLTTYMRSNDLFWGFQYDIFNFTMIQEMVLNELKMHISNLELGTYTHNVTSLHVYERHFDLLKNIYNMEDIEMPKTNFLYYDYIKMAVETLNTVEGKEIKEAKLYDPSFLNILNYFNCKKDYDGLPNWSKKFLKK
jgi:thymidylate synthase